MLGSACNCVYVKAGLEKTRVLEKKLPSVFFVFWVFLFFVFLDICPEERVFRVFQFQEYF